MIRGLTFGPSADTLRGMTALALQPGIREYILAQVAAGVRLADLGLGIAPQRISEALQGDPDYYAAKLSYHQVRLDQAEDMIAAADQTDVARARAWHDAIKWRASKECRAEYGDKPVDITINTGVSMDQALGQSAMSLLDRMRTVSDSPPALPDLQDGQDDGAPGTDR